MKLTAQHTPTGCMLGNYAPLRTDRTNLVGLETGVSGGER